MALFAAIGDRFVAKILKQVANDYNLDFEEMKTRYCGKSSFEVMVPTKELRVDLNPEPVEEVPKPKVKAVKKKDDEKKLTALSKMKKPDLVAECEERGLDSEGTVAQLKERVKEARESESPAAAAPKTKKPAAKKEKAPKEKKAKESKKKVVPPPPPPPEPLEEEPETEGEDDEPDSPGGVRAKKLRELAAELEAEEDIEEEEEEDDVQERLRKILAEAEEEEFEDEEAGDTQVV